MGFGSINTASTAMSGLVLADMLKEQRRTNDLLERQADLTARQNDLLGQMLAEQRLARGSQGRQAPPASVSATPGRAQWTGAPPSFAR